MPGELGRIAGTEHDERDGDGVPLMFEEQRQVARLDIAEPNFSIHRLPLVAAAMRVARCRIMSHEAKKETRCSLATCVSGGFRIFTNRNKLECFKHSSLMASMKQTLLHGLFPAVRAEVLRLLFTNRGQELYTREIARLSFLALRTIQDELAKLEAANLIVSRTNGYHLFYRANPKHPLHAPLVEIVRKGVAHSRANPRTLPSRR